MIAAEDSSLIFCYSSVFCIVGAFQFLFIRLLKRHIRPMERASMLCSSLERFGLFGLSGTGKPLCRVTFPALLPMLGNLQGPQKPWIYLQRRALLLQRPPSLMISHELDTSPIWIWTFMLSMMLLFASFMCDVTH